MKMITNVPSTRLLMAHIKEPRHQTPVSGAPCQSPVLMLLVNLDRVSQKGFGRASEVWNFTCSMYKKNRGQKGILGALGRQWDAPFFIAGTL